MKVLNLLEVTEVGCEIAILKLSSDEHNKLKSNAKKFVNDNHVFGNAVSVSDVHLHPDWNAGASVKSAAAVKSGVQADGSWAAVIVHYPACHCVATCTTS